MQNRDGGGMSDPSNVLLVIQGGERGPDEKLICCSPLFLPKIIMDLRRQ